MQKTSLSVRTHTSNTGISNVEAQTHKLEFIQRENLQLQDQIQELQNLLSLNRQALKLLSSTDTQHQRMLQGSFQQQKEIDESEIMIQNKGLLMVLKNLQEENIQLSKQVEKVVYERNQAQNQHEKVLLNQQITEAAQKHEKELISDLEQKISSLKSQLQQKEKIIQQLEQITPSYDEQAGIVIKYRNVISADEATLRLHDEIEVLNEQIVEMSKEIDKQKKEKKEMQQLNFKITSELIKIKSSAVNHQGKHIIICNSSSLYYSLRKQPDGSQPIIAKYHQMQPQSHLNPLLVQKQMIKQFNSSNEDSEEDAGSPLMSPLPLKNDFQAKTTKKLPKLDLSRAKQIQEINAKRQIQQMQEKQNKCVEYQILEKIQKLERNLDDAKKNLQREMLLNRTLTIENEDLMRQNENLEHINNLLSKSNINYEEKWRKIYQNYSKLQNFYITYKDQMNLIFTQTQSNNRKTSHNNHFFEQVSPNSKKFEFGEEFDSNEMKDLDKQIPPLSFFENMEQDFKTEGQIKQQLQRQYELPQSILLSNDQQSEQDRDLRLRQISINYTFLIIYMTANASYCTKQGRYNFQNLNEQPQKKIQRSLSEIIDMRNGLNQLLYQKYEEEQDDHEEQDEEQDND